MEEGSKGISQRMEETILLPGCTCCVTCFVACCVLCVELCCLSYSMCCGLCLACCVLCGVLGVVVSCVCFVFQCLRSRICVMGVSTLSSIMKRCVGCTHTPLRANGFTMH